MLTLEQQHRRIGSMSSDTTTSCLEGGSNFQISLIGHGDESHFVVSVEGQNSDAKSEGSGCITAAGGTACTRTRHNKRWPSLKPPANRCRQFGLVTTCQNSPKAPISVLQPKRWPPPPSSSSDFSVIAPWPISGSAPISERARFQRVIHHSVSSRS